MTFTVTFKEQNDDFATTFQDQSEDFETKQTEQIVHQGGGFNGIETDPWQRNIPLSQLPEARQRPCKY